MEQQTILIVDDDREIVRVISKILELEGYKILKAYDGLEALDMLVGNVVHLIMIDIMMPKMNGLAAVMKIRETNNIPIIILSAKTEETDKVLGLSMGADDYISKPFNTQEMIARVKAQLRRYMRLGAMNSESMQDSIRIGDLYLDKHAKELNVNGETVHLTATEYKIMELLMSDGRSGRCHLRIAANEFFRAGTVLIIKQVGIAVKMVKILQQGKIQGGLHITVTFTSCQKSGQINRQLFIGDSMLKNSFIFRL